MTEAITTGIIVVATWTVALTAFFVRLAMRINGLEKDHNQCRERRIYQEDLFLDKSENIQESLAVLKNDVKWIKETLQSNGKRGAK